MNPESTSEWIKILFAYGPLGAMVVALMYGIWKAGNWLAEKVILPVVTKHLAMMDSLQTAFTLMAANHASMEKHVMDIRNATVKGTAANIGMVKEIREMSSSKLTPPEQAK